MTDASRHGCDGCPLPRAAETSATRREFLRRAAALAGALGLVLTRADGAMALVTSDGARAERRYAVPIADSVAIDRENAVIVARTAGRVYAFSLACPHQNTALRWEPADSEFRCPKHKSRYRAEGRFIDGRATRAMDRLAIRRDGDSIVVDLETLYQQDEQPKEWAAAFVAV